MADKMEIEILPDGSVKVSTDAISGPNHMSAENLLRFLSEELGNKQVRVRKGHTHTHAHEHKEIEQ